MVVWWCWLGGGDGGGLVFSGDGLEVEVIKSGGGGSVVVVVVEYGGLVVLVRWLFGGVG